MNDPTVVRCRQKPIFWLLVVIFGGMGFAWLGIFHTSPPKGASEMAGFGLMLAFCFVPALLLAYWQLHACVVADAQGLRWRSLGGWHYARWDEVTDYYDMAGGNQKQLITMIETPAGMVKLGRNGWTNVDALCALVQEKATQTQGQAWGTLGERADEHWPRTFDYDTTDNRSTTWIFTICSVVLVALILGMCIPGTIRAWHDMGWAWGLATLSASSLMFIPTGLFLMLPLRGMQDTRRRRGQRIIVQADGLIYEDGATQIKAAWEEVTDYFIMTRKGLDVVGRYIIATQQGDFDFSRSISDLAILCKFITRYATAAKVTEWKSPDDDVLGGKTSRWRSGREGIGTRIYHYRTRTNRALLCLPTLYAVVPALMAVLAAFGLAPTPDKTLVAVSMVFVLYAWWCYYAASIETDGTGVTQNTIGDKRHLTWDAVEDFYISGSDLFVFGNVIGRNRRIRFWMLIADVEDLKAEIARNAVHSRSQTWEKKETKARTKAVQEKP